jgi:hypothetical protein
MPDGGGHAYGGTGIDVPVAELVVRRVLGHVV